MKNKIIVVACLVLVLCVSLILPMATAFADYTEDVLNNPQAIVNFNQLIKNQLDFTNSSVDNRSYFNEILLCNGVIIQNANIGSPRVFSTIITATQDLSGDLQMKHSGGQRDLWVYTQTNFSIISGHSYFIRFNVLGVDTSVQGGLQIKDFILIDLTQMTGINLPNLQQCQDLFVANYYPYNTGTSVSFGGLDSYVRGFNDALGSVEVALDTTLLSNNIFVNEGFVDTNVDSAVFDWGISGANAEFGFYLPNNILLGDVVTVSFSKLRYSYPTNNGSAITNFQVGYYDNGSFIVVATCNFSDLTIESSTDNIGIYTIDYSAYTFSFTSNNTINALYFRLPSNNSLLWVADLNLKVVTSNPYYAIQSSFQSGYKKAEDYYKDLYKVGGSAYQAIYNKGYYDYPTDDHFTFRSLITSAVDVPVQAFTNLFDFEILGVNMKTFYLSVFTLCVIFVVLRLVL